MVVDRMQLGVLDMSVRIVKLGLIGEQLGQVEVNPKKEIEPVKGRSDSKCDRGMANGLLRIVLGMIYITKKVMTFAEIKLFVLLRKEVDSAVGCCFRPVELIVFLKQPTEVDQSPRLFRNITEPFGDFRGFFRHSHPFLVEAHN